MGGKVRYGMVWTRAIGCTRRRYVPSVFVGSAFFALSGLGEAAIVMFGLMTSAVVGMIADPRSSSHGGTRPFLTSPKNSVSGRRRRNTRSRFAAGSFLAHTVSACDAPYGLLAGRAMDATATATATAAVAVLLGAPPSREKVVAGAVAAAATTEHPSEEPTRSHYTP